MTAAALRPELEPLPQYMRGLPVDARGYVVPWFVAWADGKPEFRAADAQKWPKAIKEKRCWVCGSYLGSKLVFVIGPMCGVNRVTSEPPCHEQCAQWSARNCPFLTLRMNRRRENDLPELCPASGIALKRNPGVALLWFCERFKVFPDPNGRALIELGEPKRLEWYAHGRKATREEIDASIESGLPTLRELCDTVQEKAELQRYITRFNALMAS